MSERALSPLAVAALLGAPTHNGLGEYEWIIEGRAFGISDVNGTIFWTRHGCFAPTRVSSNRSLLTTPFVIAVKKWLTTGVWPTVTVMDCDVAEWAADMQGFNDPR